MLIDLHITGLDIKAFVMDVVDLGEGNSLLYTTGRKDIQRELAKN